MAVVSDGGSGKKKIMRTKKSFYVKNMYVEIFLWRCLCMDQGRLGLMIENVHPRKMVLLMCDHCCVDADRDTSIS